MADDSVVTALSGLSGFAAGLRDVLVPQMQAKYNARIAKDKEVRDLENAKGLKLFEQSIQPKARLIGVDETTGQPIPGLDITGDPGQKIETFKVKPAKLKKGLADMNQAEATYVRALADDYRKDSGDFPKVRDSYRRITASAKDPSAAGDLALIFSYMRILDPASTVREGEFATAQNAGSVPQTIRAKYNKIISGERLDPNLRADFVDRAKRLYTSASKQQDDVVKQYLKKSEKAGVDEGLVITDYSDIDSRAPAVEAPAAAGNPQKIITPARVGVPGSAPEQPIVPAARVGGVVTEKQSPKPGGVLRKDKYGSRAWVYPDGTYDEVE